MSTTNFFRNIYQKKSNEELKAIAEGSDYSDDSRICAISILRERNISVADYIQQEKEIIEKRNTRSGVEISEDRYDTGVDRFIALIIDGILLSVINWTLELFHGVHSVFFVGLITIIGLSLPYLYNFLFHGYSGQTVGKMVMNIKIYDKTEMRNISYRQALLRDIVPLSLIVIIQIISYFVNPQEWGMLVYLSFIMSGILLTWSLLEIITMLFDSRKRALHDYIAGTVVLKIKS